MAPPDHHAASPWATLFAAGGSRSLAMPLMVFAVASLLGACATTADFVGAPLPRQSLATVGGISVGFNQQRQSRYRSPVTGELRPGNDLEAMVIAAIQGARSDLSVAVQELSLPGIARALAERYRAGVTVRVVLENTYSAAWSQQHPAELAAHDRSRWQRLHDLADTDGDGLVPFEERVAADAVALLQASGVPILDDTADGSKGSGLMHHKFVVVDGRTVITGSANFTSSGIHGDAGAPSTRGNANHLLRIEFEPLAQLFLAEFDRLWGDGPGGSNDSRFGRGKQNGGTVRVAQGDTTVEILFAPHGRGSKDHGLALINRVLAKAQKRVDLALFVFSDQTIATQLHALQERDVEIRLLADPGFAFRSYSEVLDLLGVARPDRRCNVENNNAPWANPATTVGVPRLARGDKLHHKFAVIDDTTVITGSFNWSPSAAHQNDETLMVIHNPQIAAIFENEFNRLLRGAELGVSQRLETMLERDRLRCPQLARHNFQ